MLEKYIAALLVPYMSKYVENINEDQLKINIWSGKAALNDLVLRPEALDALLSSIDDGDKDADAAAADTAPGSSPPSRGRKPALPIRAHRGICKNVSLSIPIKHLRSEPVVVEVGELLLTLKGISDPANGNGAPNSEIPSTTGGGAHNVKAEKWSAIAQAKANELQAFEAERKRQKEQAEQQMAAVAAAKEGDTSGNPKSGGGGFFSRLGELVINNVVVKVQTVHIRYEDETAETAIGAVLGGVQLLTMSEATGQPMFTDPSGLQKMWKRLVFNDLQVYCEDPNQIRTNAPLGRSWYSKIDDWQLWYHRMRQRARDGCVALSTVFGPVSGSLDAKVVFKMFLHELHNTPYADVSLRLQHVMASLSRGQYTKILQTIMLFTNQAEVSELQRMRPRVPVRGHARQWWRYAIRAVRSVLEEPKRKALLNRVSAACKLDYQVLYRDVVRQTEMTPEKKKSYRFVTRFMTTEDMKVGRKHVYAQIANEIQMKRKDNEIRRAEEMAKQHQTNMQQQQRQAEEQKVQRPSKRGWLSWLVGSGDPSSPDNSVSNSATSKEIEEDEKFFKTIESEYGISSADADAYQSAAVAFKSESENGLPPSYCWLRATFDLPFTSYRIDTEQGDSITLKVFHLRGGVTSFKKPGSLLFYFRTQNITLANPASSPSASLAPVSDGHNNNTLNASAATSTGPGCGALVPYLIEGVQMNRRTSRSNSVEERITMRSLTSIDVGKQEPSFAEAPTIYDVVDVNGTDWSSPSPPPTASSRRHANTHAKVSSTSTSGEDDKMPPQQELLGLADHGVPLFSITGFLNPVEQPLADTTVDIAVKVQLLPLRIVADPTTIEHLVSFFTPPAGVDVSGFAESTKHAASAVGSAASQELRAAMAKTKGLYITVDASAPVLILPKCLNANTQETALAASLGRVRFHARPLSETEKQRRLVAAAAVTNKAPLPTPTKPSLPDASSNYSSSATAAATQESLFYFPHKASFSKFYVELTTVEKAVRRPQRGFLLIPEVSIAADVLQRIDDRNTTRESFVLRLKVPTLRAACSLHQVYLITNLIDAWTSHLHTSKSKGPAAESVTMDGNPPAVPARQLGWNPVISDMLDSHAGGSGDYGGHATRNKENVKSTDGAASLLSGSSPTTSKAPVRAAVGSSDPPVIRLELLVQGLGLDVHEDDPETLLISQMPTYRVECASAELIFAVRTHHKKMVLWLKEPHIVAAYEPDHPVLSCGGLRVDVLILEGETPTGVAVSVDGALNLCFGTACMEILETTMDVVNLILSAMYSEDKVNDFSPTNGSLLMVEGGKVNPIGNAAGKDLPAGVAHMDLAIGGTNNRLSDLAYQMKTVWQQCALPNRHVADVFVIVQGPATITLLNRASGETADTPFASAAVSNVEVRLSKYAVTLDLSGRVGAVSVRVLETSGLVEENRTLLAYTPATTHRSTTSTTSEEDSGSNGESVAADKAKGAPSPIHVPRHAFSFPVRDAAEGSEKRNTNDSAVSRGLDTSDTATNAHINFSFRKSRPVMPFFKEVDGKRALANPQELRYSSALELLIDSSTITPDLNTVMVFKAYFLSGLFSRVSRLGDRPLYNGRTPPPVREGPRLLMSFRVVVRDTVVVLPVDPRTRNTQRFCASLGSLVLENSLHAAECEEKMNISLGELGMWREEPAVSAARGGKDKKASEGGRSARHTTQHSALLPKLTYMEMALRTPLDLLSDDAPRLDFRSDDVSLELRETDLVQLVTLLRQNLMRTDPTDIAKYTVETAMPARQVVVGQDGKAQLVRPTTTKPTGAAENTGGTQVAAAARPPTQRSNEEIHVNLRLGRVSMLLSNEGRGETASNPITSSASRFKLQSTGLAMSAALPSNHIGVHWKSLQLDDVRDDSSSALVWCEEGSLEFADSLTTQSILLSDFGVRQNALRSVDLGEWSMGSVTSNSSRMLSSCAGGRQNSADSTNDNAGDNDEPELTLPDVEVAHMPPRSLIATAASSTNTQLLKISVISADFTLRRFAVSDQWLALYDVTCNESVASAWTAPQTGVATIKAATAAAATTTTTEDRIGSGAGTAEPTAAPVSAKNTGMRIFVTTPNVVIPFLNSRRETLIEANIAALLVDVARLPNASTQVAVKVRELNVVDAVSGEKIIFRRTLAASTTPTTTTTRTRTATNFTVLSPAGSPGPAGAGGAGREGSGCGDDSPGLSKPPGFDVTSTLQYDWEDGWDDVDEPFAPLLSTNTGGKSGEAASPTVSDESEVLQFTFKSDPETNTNKIHLGIGDLRALVSMPIINGLVDYFTSPYEPVAKIGSLGVMREQRARMAAAAQQMANNSHLVLHVLWRQPRIILAADGLQLKRRHASNLEMRLGVMRTAVHFKSSASTLSVVVKVQEYSIPSLLRRSALRFAYQSISGAETIDLRVERTTAQFHPMEVERFVLLGQRNLLVPRDANYYGRYEKAPSPAANPAAQSSEPAATTTTTPCPSSSPSPSPSPPAPVRTIQVHIDGLFVAIHDTVGLNTHTLTLSSLDAFVAADGSVEVLVPSFGMLDQPTNRYLVQSTSSKTGDTVNPNASVLLPVASFARNSIVGGGSLDGSPKSSMRCDSAVRLRFDSTERVANAHVGAILVTVIPRSIGSLANSILSVQIPTSPAPAPTTNIVTLSATVDPKLSFLGPIKEAGKKTTPTPASHSPAPAVASNTNAKPFTFKATLTECKVRFCQGEREVALLRLSSILCNSLSHADGTSELSVTLGNLFMVDTFSTTTNFRTFIYPYGDEEDEKEKETTDANFGDGDKSIGGAAAWTASPTLVSAADDDVGAVDATAGIGSTEKTAPRNTSMHVKEVPSDSLVIYEVRTLPPNKRNDTQKTNTTSNTATPEGAASSPAVPTYTKQMRCRVRSLSFIFVPDVVRAVMDVVREVQTHVSEGNRIKAYRYVSDCAAKSVQRKAPEETLTEVDIVVSRPQILLVDKPTTTTGIQLSPGSLIVKSCLVGPQSPSTAGTEAETSKEAVHKVDADLMSQPHEVFSVQVRKLGMLLQEMNCFQQDCNIIVEYQRSLAAPASASGLSNKAASGAALLEDSTLCKSSTEATGGAVPLPPVPGAASNANSRTTVTTGSATANTENTEATVQNSLLKLDVPVLSMNFTQEQTDYAMVILGALMKGSQVDRMVRIVATATGSGCSEEDGVPTGSGAASPAAENSFSRRNPGASRLAAMTGGDAAGSPNNASALTTAYKGNSSYGGDGQHNELHHLYNLNAAVPPTAFSIDAHIGMLQADLADLFRLHVDEVRVQSTETSTTGKTIDARVDSIFIQHVGAEVDAEKDGEPWGAKSGGVFVSGTTASISHPGGSSPARKTARIQELVDLLVMTKLHVRHVQPQPSIDAETSSSVVESTITISAGVFNVAVSPTILFDTRELLYLPFCYKVLRVPIDPVPVLNLMDEATTLGGDLLLDDKHVLLTASRTRCNYMLNLNKHKLRLTGAPSGQIVLCEGCELTITNGTICIPGMYTIGSYVSFAPSTALFTTDSCKFEKEFLNVANSAFFDSIVDRPNFGLSGVKRSGKEGGTQSSSPTSTDVPTPSPGSPIDALGATTSPRAEAADDDGVIELCDRTVRVMADFYCDNMQLQMLSEEVVDLSISLHMQTHVKFVQDWENEQPVHRTVSAQMISVRSGEDEEHTLLPTDMMVNVSGVDNVSVSLVLDSMEFCTRTTLLRSLLELGKDFGAAFIEETTLSRVKPRIEYETQSLDALYPVLEAGECQHCGRNVAYLALANNQPGILCYKCCTGYDSLPAIDFRVEVPLVDGVLFGSSGDMAHLYMRNVLLSVDPSMDLQLTLRISLYGFNNAAAVWEPVVEQFDATITGSVSTHDYHTSMERLDYVLSPQSIRLLSGMIADYGAATALQKQLRKRFRRQKQQRTQQVAPNQGAPMYVNADVLDEIARVELQEETMAVTGTDNAEQDGGFFHPIGAVATSPSFRQLNNMSLTAALANTSIFDILNSTNRFPLAGAMGLGGGGAQDTDAQPVAELPKRGYAHVYVKNHCNVPLMVDGCRVTPRGGTLRFIARNRTVKVSHAVNPDSDEREEDYATSISNPPLYVETKDMVLETKVSLSQEDSSRYLRRTITMTVYPLHESHTMICYENRLQCQLACTGNYPPIKPGERVYLTPKTDLNAPIQVQPVHTPDRVEYEAGKVPGEALDSGSVSPSTAMKTPSIHDVLCGFPLVMVCKAKSQEGKFMTVKTFVRQEEMRGGVPTFVVAFEPRFHMRNRLPYRLIVNVLPDPNGDLVRGRTPARPVQPLVSTVLEVRQGADLALNTCKLDQVAFLLEVRQRRPQQAVNSSHTNANNDTGNNNPLASSTSLAASLRGKATEEEEVFSTLVPMAINEDNPYISLRSQFRRELLIHAIYVPSKGSVVFTTPYVLLNHSPLALTLRECKSDGTNKLYDAEPNYSVLPPKMSASVAAAPMGIKDSENFFVNIYHEQYRGTCVPLHAQQRGVVILQDCTTTTKSAKSKAFASSCSGGSKKSDPNSMPSATKVGPTVIHLAYSSQIDPCGSLLVTITPRWIVVNRSHMPLYIAPSTYNGITAEEANATATAAIIASQQKHSGIDDTAESDAGVPASPTQQQQKVDAMKKTLQDMVAENSIVFLADAPTQVVALPPYSATPFYETPLCTPEVGYNIHVMQSPLAPLYGTPVGIESIHSELIVAYKPVLEPHEVKAGANSSSGDKTKDTQAERDRFLEVSLVVRGSYTYVVLEPLKRPPYLLLNRTAYMIEVRDTAIKSKGRLMARVEPGCGADLILDTSVTTLVRVRLFNVDKSKWTYEVTFDVGRPMTRREVTTAMASAAGVMYTLGFGSHGQQLIVMAPAKPTLQPAYTSVAAPPVPINALLNLGVATLSVVMPNCDVLFCAVMDIRFSWDRQKDREVMKFSVENFQVDNQTEVSPRYDSCILSLRTSTSFAAASGYVERVLVPAKGFICLDEVRLDFVPLALRVSDTLLVACAGFFQAVRSGDDAPNDYSENLSTLSASTSTLELQEAAAAPHERCPSAMKLYNDAPVQIDAWASKLTLERFIINPIVVRVWLTRDSEEHDFFRENINSKDAALLSMMVQSCEDVTVAAPGVVTAQQRSRLGVFAEWVLKTYQDGLIAQLKGLLLQYASSLPLIGTPLKLASGFGNGAVRLFRDPIEGLSTSPSAFAQGIARGSAGFAQEFAGGGLGAFSNFTDSWSRLLSMGGGVSEKERRKQNTLTGLTGGFLGIIRRPMEGAAESGATGFLKGTAQGLVGVVANPMSGLLSDVSRAAGTLGKLVTDTYIPKTHRLRPIRDFHANGGVAPWRSLVSVYQYQRLKTSTQVFTGDQLLSSVDGPEWYPSKREGATYGPNKIPIPEERWILDRYHTNFEGWTYSTKYYGLYSERLTSQVRVRRKRWTALVRPLPYSRVAFYLHVAPGMEMQRRRTASLAAIPSTTPQETNIEFTSPGQLQATTVEQAKARQKRFLGITGIHLSRHGSSDSRGRSADSSGSPRNRKRATNEYFAEEEYAAQRETLYQRMRQLTATGRHVGVKADALKGPNAMLADDNTDTVSGNHKETSMYSLEAGSTTGGTSAASPVGAGGTIKLHHKTENLQAPDAPRNRQKQKKHHHSRSASELDATSRYSTPSSDRRSSDTSQGEEKGGISRRDRKKAEAMTAATLGTGGEAVGSKMPQPGASRFVRSNSGKVQTVDAAATLASVPGASPTFVSRTSGTAAAPLPTTIVEIYEYEKRVALVGWGKRYLPSECPGWQDTHGNEVPRRQDIRAPAGWTWTTDWTIVGGDSSGWTMMNEQKNLRRRMWQRRLVKQPSAQQGQSK